MTHTNTLQSITETSAMKKLKQDKFALLARVGHQKRAALALQDEANFYSSLVIEHHAILRDAFNLLEQIDGLPPATRKQVITLTSRWSLLIKRLLAFSPSNSESLDRVLSVLTSDGLEKEVVLTPDGLLSLSSDRILRNVESAIEVMRELNQKTSSN